MDFGLIGNGQSAALVSKTASVAWCCLPQFDSPSVFASLMDAKTGGEFSITLHPPKGQASGEVTAVNTTQRYLKNTAILETELAVDGASVRVLDFFPRWSLEGDEDYHTPPQFFRLIEPLTGPPNITVILAPQLHYAKGTTTMTTVEPGVCQATNGNDALFLQCSEAIDEWDAPIPIALDGPVAFVVSHGQPLAGENVLLAAQQALRRTTSYWRRWVRHCYLPDEYQSEIIRSALTLKMLIYQPTGAVIAAPTTSLPEIAGGCRTWDYRFCWLRDSFFVIEALLQISHFEETEHYLRYLCCLMRDDTTIDKVRPLYTIDGDPVPSETFLPHWQGYLGGQPVRIGNDATDHHQHDVYGELMLSLFPVFFDERFVEDNLAETPNFYHWVQQLVHLAQRYAPLTDNGIWEFRDLLDHYTFSKLMCWVALDRGAKIAFKRGRKDDHETWHQAAIALQQEILDKAWNPGVGAFTQAYGSPHLDASTLLMPRVGFIHPRDPRMLATIEKTKEKLLKNGLLFRYTNIDDFGAPENAFTICTFWMIDALLMAGDVSEAREMFHNVLQYGNHVGLFSEDIDLKTGELTGNFPQGYTHVAIINSAMALAQYGGAN